MRPALSRLLFPLAFVVVFGAYLSVSGCGLLKGLFDKEVEREKVEQVGPLISTITPTPGAVNDVVSLPQGWSEDTVQKWATLSQGSEIVPYAYFLHLERPGSQELFRSEENMRAFRYLPQQPTSHNPDGLPVGFARFSDAETGDWMGLTCAACHTAQIAYDDRQMRIEGGPTLADYRSFQDSLNVAITVTATDDAKFERFARAVLHTRYSASTAAALRRDLRQAAANLDRRNRQNRSPLRDGYGRIDALGQIFNAVTAYDLGIDDNARPPDAPVSYPFLWDTAQTDLVQWNGSVPNKGPGAVARNVGELVGVFGHVDLDPSRGADGYLSSIDAEDLGDLEVYLEDLWSPQWPEAILPAIDRPLAAQGAPIYAAQCQSCHALIDRTDPARRYPAVMTPVDEIGTDRALVTNFSGWLSPDAVDSGVLEGAKENVIFGDEIGPRTTGLKVLTNAIIGILLADKGETVHIALEDWVTDLPTGTENLDAYKGRPLNGIWATAPYLHNGSVPTLYDLLLPVGQRPASFWVGNREFDPVKVGYVTTPGQHGFTFDTSVRGNRNTGHTAGTDLSDADRRALVEYLKTL